MLVDIDLAMGHKVPRPCAFQDPDRSWIQGPMPILSSRVAPQGPGRTERDLVKLDKEIPAEESRSLAALIDFGPEAAFLRQEVLNKGVQAVLAKEVSAKGSATKDATSCSRPTAQESRKLLAKDSADEKKHMAPKTSSARPALAKRPCPRGRRTRRSSRRPISRPTDKTPSRRPGAISCYHSA